MTGKVHRFDLRVGGNESRGKTSGNEDRFKARFVELTPPKKIVEAVDFDSDDPAFSGEMIMEVGFEAEGSGTNVTVLLRNIPPGIRPEDNEAGTAQTLQKLARCAE